MQARWFQGCVGALLLLGAAPTFADPATQQAKRHNQQGKKLFNLGRFSEAAEEYHKAYVAKPVSAFLFNLAQCHKRLAGKENVKKAVFYYRSYLKNEPFTAMRESVEEEIAKLERQLRELERPVKRAFYKTWWFWTAVGAVVAGATVGTVLALQPKDEQPPALDLTLVVRR